MIPSKYVKVPELIYTVSGKADRNKMLSYIKDNIYDVKETELVMDVELSELEKNILTIAASVFEEFSGQITLDTTLESLGINSLLYIKFIAEIEDAYDIEFENDTLLETSFYNVREIIACVQEMIESKE